jgi:hypothetical protein
MQSSKEVTPQTQCYYDATSSFGGGGETVARPIVYIQLVDKWKLGPEGITATTENRSTLKETSLSATVSAENGQTRLSEASH